jgi:signal transduction histidine kinase
MVNGVEGCLAAGKPAVMAMALTGTARNTVEIKITNFGVELSDKEIQKIFTPFHTTKQTGSGLGLYISRKLIEEMGGKLTLTSSIGSGAVTALIELPKQAK